MADYSEAFNKGLDAAREAQLARAEINKSLVDLSGQLKTLSEGRVSIGVYNCSEKNSDQFGVARALAMATGNYETRRYQALEVERISGGKVIKHKELSEWRESKFGYPCKLTWPGTEVSAYDRESLEEAFKKLLSDPGIGEKIQEFINIEEPPELTIEASRHEEGDEPKMSENDLESSSPPAADEGSNGTDQKC